MSSRVLTGAFVLVFVVHFLHAVPFFTLVHLPGFLVELGAEEAQIGVVVATLHGVAILMRPSVGRIIDVHGRRAVMLAGGAINVLASLLYLTIDQLGPWVYVVRGIHGLAEAALFAVLFTIAADLAPASRRTETLAIFGISGLLPLAVGGLLGDWILARGTYSDLFWVLAGAAALGLVLSLPVADSRPSPEPDEESARSVLASALQADLMPIWLVALAFAVGIASYFTFLKTFVLETNVGSVGAFFTVYVIAAVLLRAVLGWVPDRVGAKRVLYPAMLSLCAALVLLARAQSDGEVIVAGFVAGVGHGYVFPILSSMVVNRARTAERGAAIALFTAVMDLGVLVGGPTLGLVVQRFGYSVMFVAAGALPAVGALVFAIWDRRRP
jgi:MFS family permease